MSTNIVFNFSLFKLAYKLACVKVLKNSNVGHFIKKYSSYLQMILFLLTEKFSYFSINSAYRNAFTCPDQCQQKARKIKYLQWVIYVCEYLTQFWQRSPLSTTPGSSVCVLGANIWRNAFYIFSRSPSPPATHLMVVKRLIINIIKPSPGTIPFILPLHGHTSPPFSLFLPIFQHLMYFHSIILEAMDIRASNKYVATIQSLPFTYKMYVMLPYKVRFWAREEIIIIINNRLLPSAMYSYLNISKDLYTNSQSLTGGIKLTSAQGCRFGHSVVGRSQLNPSVRN